MIIHLNREWRISSDAQQWIAQRRRTVKGEDKWDSRSFHGSLDGAVMWLAWKRIRLVKGVYGPEALPVLCHALDSLRIEIMATLKALSDRPAFREGRKNDG